MSTIYNANPKIAATAKTSGRKSDGYDWPDLDDMAAHVGEERPEPIDAEEIFG